VAKRAMARVARPMAMAMRVVENKESNGKGGKDNSDGNEDGEQQRGQWQGRQGLWQWQ
jgi:hypothetical protein